MILYLIRHAHAGHPDDRRWSDDRLRPLSPKGQARFAETMKKLAKRGVRPLWIATSPLVRCFQTAELVAEAQDPAPPIFRCKALQPESRLDEAVAETAREAAGLDQIAWVGHAPDVGELAAALIGGQSAAIDFAKGAVAAISFEGPLAPGSGELRWLVNAAVLGVED